MPLTLLLRQYSTAPGVQESPRKTVVGRAHPGHLCDWLVQVSGKAGGQGARDLFLRAMPEAAIQ